MVIESQEGWVHNFAVLTPLGFYGAYMEHYRIIYITSLSILILCCVWMVGLVFRLGWKRPCVFQFWVTWPIMIWLMCKSVTLTCYIGSVFYFDQIRLFLLVAVAINAAAAVAATVSLRITLSQFLSVPSYQVMRTTNDALAKKVGELSTLVEETVKKKKGDNDGERK